MENKQETPYYAAVVVINSDGKVLLGKRKEDGIWTTPGGSAEPNETDPMRTAIRELFEEAAIPCSSAFLQPLEAIATRNNKLCHVFLYVCSNSTIASSKLDPDAEINTWKWFAIDEIPNGLKEDERRLQSVRNGYMKYYGINKSLTEKLEKGGKPAAIGEVRTFSGTDYKKMGSGDWKPVVHPEQQKLDQMDAQKEKSPRQQLTEKLQEKTKVTQIEQHLQDLTNSPVLEGVQTKSEKPMFTNVESALAAKYDATDFREAGNFYYDRAEKLNTLITRMEETKQEVEPALYKVQKLNSKLGKQFLSQANHISDRQAKTSKMTKSVVHMGHVDAASINTGEYAVEHNLAYESGWLTRFQELMEGYAPGEVPRSIKLDTGTLYLVKVDDGLYSGLYKIEQSVEDGQLTDTAKVRIERMTLPSLIQFCMAKEWIKAPLQSITAPQIEQLTGVLAEPVQYQLEPKEQIIDKKIKFLELISKLIN